RLYFDASTAICVDRPSQLVAWSRVQLGDLQVLRVGSKDQAILNRAGDDLRIDWGFFYLVVPGQPNATTVITSDRAARDAFAATGMIRNDDDLRMPRSAGDKNPVLACVLDMGQVGVQPVSRHLLLAYDDVLSIEYFHRKLRPYWRRHGMEIDELLRAAVKDY